MGVNLKKLLLEKTNRISYPIYRFTLACGAIFLYCGVNIPYNMNRKAYYKDLMDEFGEKVGILNKNDQADEALFDVESFLLQV